MIKSNFNNIKISGIVAAVSNNWISVNELETDNSERTIKKFKKMSGVMGKYVAGDYQTTSDFAFEAADKLLNEQDIDRNSIGALIFVTQTPDYFNPATACVLQHRLGLSESCMAFDVNLGCSGYVYGLNIVFSLMSTSNIDKAILLAGDTSAKEKNQKNKVTMSNSHKLLFGDAGTATLIERDTEDNCSQMSMMTKGEGWKAIMNPFSQWRHPDKNIEKIMDDVEVFNFSTDSVPEMINDFMDEKDRTPADYDCLVLHQANLLILQRIAKLTNFPMEKVLVSLDEYGNTSSASIPISLVKEYGDKDEGEIKVLMCGFGIGLSCGIVELSINTKYVHELIHTDYCFDDGLK